MKLDLYRIDKEYELLFNLIEERGFDDEMMERLTDASHEFDTTVLNVGALLKNLKAKILLMKQYEQDMEEKRFALERDVKKYEDFLKKNMPLFNLDKVEGPELSVRVSSTTPRLEVLTDDLSKVDNIHKHIKVVESISKEAIRACLEDGEEIPYARLVPNYSLTIK